MALLCVLGLVYLHPPLEQPGMEAEEVVGQALQGALGRDQRISAVNQKACFFDRHWESWDSPR